VPILRENNGKSSDRGGEKNAAICHHFEPCTWASLEPQSLVAGEESEGTSMRQSARDIVLLLTSSALFAAAALALVSLASGS
jgi:hypothetical protein